MISDTILNSLESIFDTNDLKTDFVSKTAYSKDWSSVASTEPIAVVFPNNIEQLTGVVDLCNKTKISFIGSGGRTGLSGGATAINHELIISFDKMNKVIDFDSDDNTVLCEPGITTAEIQNFALSNNLYYPVDFSSSGSSQIGGNIATNAGGIKVIKYGLTKNYVCGLEILSGDARMYSYDKNLVKDATGPNLKDLFIGSEGVFGLFTKCRLKFIEKPPETKVGIIGFNKIKNLSSITSSIIKNNNIEAIEFFTENCVEAIKKYNANYKKLGMQTKYFLIIEYSSDSIEEIFENLLFSKNINDVVISQSGKQKEEMWRNRLMISESINHLKPLKFDLAVPIDNFSKLISEIEKLSYSLQNIKPILFGHAGDGNLHVNLIALNNNFLQKEIVSEIVTKIYNIVKILRGTISAEHGIGVLKRDIFMKTIPSHDLAVLKALKKLYDPNSLLNPGKLIKI